MKKPKKKTRPMDSTEAVAPFARIRIIAFLICLIVGLGVLAYRKITG